MQNRFVPPRRAEEEALRSGGRLPPGQSLTHKFPVLHYGPIPSVDLATWTFRLFGAVAEEKVWTWADFERLPRSRVSLDLHCVTRWSKFDTRWEGVSLGSLVAAGIVRPEPEARYVIQHCENGYTTNTPIELALSENMLMATHYDGQPLTPEHGYPLRMVVGVLPRRREQMSAYLWKGGKWLRGLEFSRRDRPGFWEQRGYHNRADPWLEERFG